LAFKPLADFFEKWHSLRDFCLSVANSAPVKFVAEHSWVSLAVIVLTLVFSILLSMLISDEQKIKELEAEIEK